MTQYGSPPPGQTPPADSPDPAGLITMTSYAAGVFAALAFLCGFLDWLGSGYPGFVFGGSSIGFVIVAGLLAVLATAEKKPVTSTPLAASVTGLLLVFGLLVRHADADTSSGLYLTFVLALLQSTVLAYGWLLTTGRVTAPKPKPPAPQHPPVLPYAGQPYPGQPYQGPPYSGQPYPGQPYAAPQYGGQYPGQAPPAQPYPGPYAPPSTASAYGSAPPGQQTPPGYGPPPGPQRYAPPGYQPPTAEPGPSSPPHNANSTDAPADPPPDTGPPGDHRD